MSTLIYGYIRNIPNDPEGKNQYEILRNRPIETWIHENSYRDNDQLAKLTEELKMGDRVYVESFLSFSHSLSHLLSLIEIFKVKGAHLHFHKEQVSIDAPVIMTLENIVRTLSDFQSEATSLATKAGMDEAKERGSTTGRPRKKDANVQKALEMYATGYHTLKEIKEKTNISKSTLYRYLDKDYSKSTEGE